jgi:hypothetical protein
MPQNQCPKNKSLIAEQYRRKVTNKFFQKLKCIEVTVVPHGRRTVAVERYCFPFRNKELKVEELLVFAE